MSCMSVRDLWLRTWTLKEGDFSLGASSVEAITSRFHVH